MAQIKIMSSMALDAICFIDQYNCLDSSSNLLEEQMNFIEDIEILSSGKLKNGSLSMSDLSSILTAYAENAEFENYTLDDLAKLFKNPEAMREAVKLKFTSEFQASYIAPVLDKLVDKWAEIYVNYINILKEAEFDKLWEADLLPVIQEEIRKKEKIYSRLDIKEVLVDIQKLKQCEPLGDVKIYVSFMSFPIAFKLHGNNFLDCIYGSRGAGIICHELMHGFATAELERLYLDYINSIKYLTEQHNRLINEQHSGNEEEFVAAAEYYLRMKYNQEDKKDLLREAGKQYGGCMPTSVFLFDLLSKEIETPNNYAQWLTTIFKNGKLPKKAIERNLTVICPKEPIEEIYDKLFGSFKIMIDKIKEIQVGRSFDIEKKIENIINQKFEEISDKSVYFAQERQPLPNALNVKELYADNLFINIAEYKNKNDALFDRINDDGSNIGPAMEKVNNQWRALYNVNMSLIGRTPVTLSATFIKDNYRISFTIRCPEYVNRGIDYPANLKEFKEHFFANMKSLQETGKPIKTDRPILSADELMLKYSDEILSAQKQIEDIIIKL